MGKIVFAKLEKDSTRSIGVHKRLGCIFGVWLDASLSGQR